MSQKITVRLDLRGPVTFEVLDGAKDFFSRQVKNGPAHVGTLLDCMHSESESQRFVVAAALHKIIGGPIEPFCHLCRTNIRREELGIWT